MYTGSKGVRDTDGTKILLTTILFNQASRGLGHQHTGSSFLVLPVRTCSYWVPTSSLVF